MMRLIIALFKKMHLINAIEGNMHSLKIVENLTITFGMLITFRNASRL